MTLVTSRKSIDSIVSPSDVCHRSRASRVRSGAALDEHEVASASTIHRVTTRLIFRISGHRSVTSHGITRRGPRSGGLARQWAVPSSLERRRRTRVWGFQVSTFESATLVRELTIRRCRKCTRYVAAPNLASSALPLSVHQRSLRTHYYHSLRHACLHVFLAHERVPVLHFSSPLHWQLGAGNGRGRCRLPDWWPHLSERGVRCVPV